MITGYINGQELRISSPALAADSIKYLEAEFHFAGHDWDGFTKTAYFLNDGKKIALTLAGDRITADMGLNLTEGEWAVKLSGVKGGTRITTTTQRIYVRGFGSTDGELPDVTATQAEQLQAQIGDLGKLKTKAKSDLVAAINEAAQNGGGGIADSDIFVIPVTVDLSEETGEGATTVTFDEIIEAHNDGKTLLCAAEDSAQGLSAILTEYLVTPTRAAFNALIEGGAIALMVAISKDGTATKAQYAASDSGVALTTQWSYTDEQKEQLRVNFDLAAKTDKLASPYALTFSGAASGTYDGSEAASITIPDASDIKIYATLDDFIARRFTDRAAMVLNAPSAAITPGAWSDVGFPTLAYTSGVSHGEAEIYLTSCTTAKKCSVSLQMDGSYSGPHAIAATPDHSLGLTGATVGQIAKISAVDDNGRPTAWAAVDAPIGGADEAWEYIGEATCTENVQVFLMDKDSEGNAFALKEIAIVTYSPAFTGDTVGTGRALSVYPTSAWGHGTTNMANAPAAKNNETARYELHCLKLYGGSMRLIERFASHNSTNARGTLIRQNIAGDAPISFDVNADDPFTLRNAEFTGAATCVKLVGYANTAISAGTKIKVWGVRA